MHLLALAAILFTPVCLLTGQSIILDLIVEAGDLKLYPSMEDDKAYYYIPDQARLAQDENGNPKFSFLRYVDNTDSGDEGEGGGIVHAVVMLDVTPEQLREAEQELASKVQGAKIMGPITYRSGTVALVSSIAQPNGEFAKKVIGLGKAPLLDGHKAAVSIQLTKLGAKVLHASFQTPTPDMTFSFEMSISGYRLPKKAIIEADFEKVYEHKSFQAAVASPILSGEIDLAFDDLVQSGAIKVINKGADEQMESLINEAYNKLTRLMFEPAGGTGTPSLSQLTSQAGGRPSMLDRATNLLNQSRTEARAENAQIRAENQRQRDAAENQARQTQNASASGDNQSQTSAENNSQAQASGEEGQMAPRPYTASEGSNEPSTHAARVDPNNPAAAAGGPPPRQEVEVPSIAIAASFQMRKVRQKGTYRIDLEKWSADNQAINFAENVGRIDCEACFVDVNLQDPLYRQRELVASLDGMDAQDFGQYINFVNVTMKKTHATGETTIDEVKIDRQNFNEEGNNFRLIYGWKNDNNRSKWEEYEYKSIWNFFGGGSIQADWTKSDIQVIPLSAPYIRREILVDADPDRILDAGVRAIEIKVFYTVGDRVMNKQIRLNTRADEYSTQFDIVTPKDQTIFEYEIVWFMRDGSTRNSGKKEANSTMLFVDQIP